MEALNLERLMAIEREIVKLTIGATSIYPGTHKARKDLERVDRLTKESERLFAHLRLILS